MPQDPGPAMQGTNVGQLSGFGNYLSSEALSGALPIGRNSPQRPAHGLYAEQLNCTAFTAPRSDNRRTWLYRIRPSVSDHPYRRLDAGRLRGGPFTEFPASPEQRRWNPMAIPTLPTDFVNGLLTIGGNGAAALQQGIAIHLYAANRSMHDSVFCNADGEMLLVPEQGELALVTELGRLHVGPGAVALIPRGLRLRVELAGPHARGYMCENYGNPFRLPELGPLGANGLAGARDFEAPTAWYEDLDSPCRLVTRFNGCLWQTDLDHSPLDVVAWHGNAVPMRYDLSRFNVMGTVSFDHPDPSIFTCLTSPSEIPGVANCDFVVIPPRWLVGEDTFRPPYFHRNVMSEYMGLIQGVHDAKAEGFQPGGGSLHNCLSPHGPDRRSFEGGSDSPMVPQKMENTLAFMFETRFPISLTAAALEPGLLQPDYLACWRDMPRRFSPQQ